MTREEAKYVLTLYRDARLDPDDPQMAEALALARRDPELGRWFEQHRATQAAIREKFTTIAAPADLPAAILSAQRIVRPAYWWQKPAWLAAAAAVVLLVSLWAIWSRPMPTQQFGLWRARMVSSTQREYPMQVKTNNLDSIRTYLSTNRAPADFAIESKLEQLPITGAGHILWGTQSVSMVCFRAEDGRREDSAAGGDREMLFLFVINKAGLKDAPGRKPRLDKVSGLQTASWSRGTNTYLLAGPDDPAFLEKYGPTQ